MKLSMKTDYALRALIELADRYGQGPVQSGDIAAKQGIPEPYLDQLMTMLRKAGIIRSLRGPQGGHLLANLPAQIRVDEIVVLLEGSMAAANCVERPEDCQVGARCAIRELWQRWEEASLALLRSVTIADLAERQAQYRDAVMYHI